ncbi:DISARM system SNF2-like helicase DrmD [Gordonia sp. CPCC 205333]|uniref:DISARM system SNF2-like helicase DrmD n=1 Tax=Gordonia sp. CPCC 205333 TaxID=3140790 RepID=UPI003AF376A9
MTSTFTTPIPNQTVPEPGQLVEVRRRQWVVAEAPSGSSLPGAQSQHLVTLASLDEDALGEELQVIWELEPGARVLDKAGLPAISGWDSDDRLEAFLDAVRWGAATNANRSFLQAPFRSGISIEDYQLDPLVRAIDMARVNLLIADDVGLGKTIEAGLVVQELLVRHRARTVLIVCPASLQAKWQTEMQEKFGLEFRIVDTDYVKQLRRSRGVQANPWTSFPRLITSMDWAKSGEGLRLLKDVLPPQAFYPRKFDILIVDEAHNVAPAAATRYALESQRTRLIRTLAPHFTHRLFLTATPHNGYQASFTSLLELLDDQRFARSILPDEQQLHRVMVRRLKSDITDADGNSVFPARKLVPLAVAYTDEEREAHALLQRFILDRSKSVSGSKYAYGTDFAHKLLKKRLFSSPSAFATTLARHRETLSRGPRSSKSSPMDDRVLRKAILRTEEDQADDSALEDAQQEAVELATELAAPLSPEQRDMLDRLTAWAEKSRNKADSKATAILDWIASHLKNDDGEWNDKRVILFTEYRATHTWLQQILASHGYGGDRLTFLHGDVAPDEREIVKAAFQADPAVSAVRILLATDAASEGIDLQNYCNYLIHVEVPWNPNVMEQRNGRIDRHGQKQEAVFIWHPVGRTHDGRALTPGEVVGDHEYLMRAASKVETIREDLGSVGPVIARQIEEIMLGRRTGFDTSSAEAHAARARRFVSAERQLRERIQRLHNTLLQAQDEFHMSPTNVARAVEVALDLAEKPALIPRHLSTGSGATIFTVPELAGSWGKATHGLEHPHTRERRPITFDHAVAKGNDDVVLAHIGHRLVQMCLRLLREEIWKVEDTKKLHRVTVRSVPDSLMSQPVVLLWSRLVVTGGDHRRLHEELPLSGGELGHDRFSRIHQVGRREELLRAAAPIAPSDALFAVLKRRFENNERAIMAAVEARSKERLDSLDKTLTDRMSHDVADLDAVLSELERAITKELRSDEEGSELYLPGLSPQEMNQVTRDIAALEARLARIPEERRAEEAAIMRQYADPVARTFPAAVIFLVPESMTTGG